MIGSVGQVWYPKREVSDLSRTAVDGDGEVYFWGVHVPFLSLK